MLYVDSHDPLHDSTCIMHRLPSQKTSKIPAQVRMMRSWGLFHFDTEMDKGSELGDSFDKGVSHWVDAKA